MESFSKVAIIGMGKIGTVLATNLVKGGRAVIVADRTNAKAEALAKSLGKLAAPRDVVSAIKEADLIILAVWYETIKEFLKKYSVELQGKIIIDPCNPLALAEGGGFKKIIDQDQSAGQLLSAMLPKGARLVKAFCSLSAESLSGKAFQQPERAVIFYATDDTGIKDRIEDLIRAVGFDPLGLGGINQSIRIEAFGDLAEYGGLGKTVTLAEARAIVEKTGATPIDTVIKLLTNIADPNVIRSLVAEDATYVSLNFNNPELKKIMPWCGTNVGISAFVNNLSMVYQCWETLEFKPTEIFGSDDRVAIFGSFKYRSKVLNQVVDSPFSIFSKVKDGKVTYLQFMEDTFATAASFHDRSTGTYRNFPDSKPITV